MKNHKHLLFCGLLILTTVCVAECAFATSSQQSETSGFDASLRGSSWRFTEYGWQDSSSWYVEPFVPHPNLELIHPVILALLVLTLAVTAMVWASNEWEIARLFGNPSDRQDQEDSISDPECESPQKIT